MRKKQCPKSLYKGCVGDWKQVSAIRSPVIVNVSDFVSYGTLFRVWLCPQATVHSEFTFRVDLTPCECLFKPFSPVSVRMNINMVAASKNEFVASQHESASEEFESHFHTTN